MIKKLSIFAGISFAIFGIVAVVVAQQAERRQIERELTPVEKITSKLGDLSNSIKKGFTPSPRPKSTNSNNSSRSRRHTTGQRATNRNTYGSKKTKIQWNLLVACSRESIHERQHDINRIIKHCKKHLNMNRLSMKHRSLMQTVLQKSVSSRRNPQRFQQSPSEAEYIPKSRPNLQANTSAVIREKAAPTTIDNNATVNNSTTLLKKESTAVQPGGYKSLRERLLTARKLTQDQTKLATKKINNEPKPLNMGDNHQTTISNAKSSTEIKSEPYNPEPIRIEAKPSVANSVDVNTNTKSEDPGWNKVEPSTPVEKENLKKCSRKRGS